MAASLPTPAHLVDFEAAPACCAPWCVWHRTGDQRRHECTPDTVGALGTASTIGVYFGEQQVAGERGDGQQLSLLRRQDTPISVCQPHLAGKGSEQFIRLT